MKTLIIVPAYNEEQNIVDVLTDIKSHILEADVIVIDDGSKDSTAERAAGLGIPVLSLSYNLGIGAAMQTGYRYAFKKRYDVAIQFDGDGQHRADQILAILRPLLEGKADMVIGSRFSGKKEYRPEWSRMVGIKILSRMISLLIGQKITDPTSGFRAVNRHVIELFRDSYPDDYPEPEAIVFLKRAGFRIVEVPAAIRERRGGTSSITTAKGLYYMAKVILAILIDMLKKIPKRR